MCKKNRGHNMTSKASLLQQQFLGDTAHNMRNLWAYSKLLELLYRDSSLCCCKQRDWKQEPTNCSSFPALPHAEATCCPHTHCTQIAHGAAHRRSGTAPAPRACVAARNAQESSLTCQAQEEFSRQYPQLEHQVEPRMLAPAAVLALRPPVQCTARPPVRSFQTQSSVNYVGNQAHRRECSMLRQLDRALTTRHTTGF